MIYLYIFLLLLAIVIVRNIFRIGFKKYILNVLIGIDQLANALLGGEPDETISCRCARGQGKWYWRVLGRFLEWLDPGHLQKAYNSELNRNHLPFQLKGK